MELRREARATRGGPTVWRPRSQHLAWLHRGRQPDGDAALRLDRELQQAPGLHVGRPAHAGAGAGRRWAGTTVVVGCRSVGFNARAGTHSVTTTDCPPPGSLTLSCWPGRAPSGTVTVTSAGGFPPGLRAPSCEELAAPVSRLEYEWSPAPTSPLLPARRITELSFFMVCDRTPAGGRRRPPEIAPGRPARNPPDEEGGGRGGWR